MRKNALESKKPTKKNVMEIDLSEESEPKFQKNKTKNIKKKRVSTTPKKKKNIFDANEYDKECKQLGKAIRVTKRESIKRVNGSGINDDTRKGRNKYDHDPKSGSDTELDSNFGSDSFNNEPVSTDTVQNNSKYFNSQIRAYASIKNTDKLLQITKKTNKRTKNLEDKIEIIEHKLDIIKDSLEQQKERFYDDSNNAPSIDFAPIVPDEIELDPDQKKNISRLVDEFKGLIGLNDDIIRQHLGKHTPIADINLLKLCYIKNISKNKICLRCISDQNYQYYVNGEWYSDKYGRYIREVLAKNVIRLYMSVNKMEHYFPNTPDNGISINANKSFRELEKENLKQDTYTRNLEYISSIQKASSAKRDKYEKDLLNRLKHDISYRTR